MPCQSDKVPFILRCVKDNPNINANVNVDSPWKIDNPIVKGVYFHWISEFDIWGGTFVRMFWIWSQQDVDYQYKFVFDRF